MNEEEFYQARKRRDISYEGKFYIGVPSRGIFCSVTCPAPLPIDRGDIVFFQNIYCAFASGLQPCPDCEPDMGLERINANNFPNLIANAMDLIGKGYLNTSSVENLAHILKVSERHLRKLFKKYIGISPTKIAMYNRAIFSKKLLAGSCLSITAVAYTSGFGSIRQFNHTFLEIYNISPTKFRSTNHLSVETDQILRIPYKHGYNFNKTLGNINKYAIRNVCCVTDKIYSSTFCINGILGHLTVSNNKNKSYLELLITSSDARCYMAVLHKISRMFNINIVNLNLNPSLCRSINVFQRKEHSPGLLTYFEPYQCFMYALLRQFMIHKHAMDCLEKITTIAGTAYTSKLSNLEYIFPDMFQLESHIREIPLQRSISNILLKVNAAIKSGALTLAYHQTYRQFYRNFSKIDGIEDSTIIFVAKNGLGLV